MIYIFFCFSLVANGVLIWYIRKLLTKYWYDVDARQSFTAMLTEYSESLKSIYKLEELYGEEIIKKAITQTKLVVQACEEFKEILEKETVEETEETINQENSESFQNQETSKSKEIKIKEGEKISQDADKYKRIIIDDLIK